MEDAQIVDLYWARSEQAIAETSAKYGSYCYAIAYNIPTYAVGQTVYAAFEFDHAAITPQQVQEIAASVEFVFEHEAQQSQLLPSQTSSSLFRAL